MARRSAPVRTCVGCRERSVATKMLRVVAVQVVTGPGETDHTILPDPASRLPGRGASLHPDAGCLALAERRRAFLRALRVQGPLDLTALWEHLAQPGRTLDTARSC